jgi:hypothetical protein
MMKYFALLISLLACTWVFAQTEEMPFTTDTIPVADALQFVGQYRVFCDDITKSTTLNNVSGQPTMMTLGEGSGALTLVFWAGDAANFPKPVTELYPVGTKVCVQGQISSHGGSSRLEIGHPRQVHIISR